MINLGFINFITYFFILVTLVAGGVMVIKKNPVHAVLSLILSFVGGAGLLLINNAEFLSFILLSVYVGAVMVLFLFVVMMIDTNLINHTKISWCEKWSALLVAILMFGLLFGSMKKEVDSKHNLIANATELAVNFDNSMVSKNQAREFGKILYDENNLNFFPFKVCV